jgi:hypothetical protein
MFTAQSRPPIHQLKEWNDGMFAALDTIRFWTFKELVNARSRISFYPVRRLDNNILKSSIDHITTHASAVNPR